jgi:hypothetical protein
MESARTLKITLDSFRNAFVKNPVLGSQRDRKIPPVLQASASVSYAEARRSSDPAVTGDDEISPGLSWRLKAARYPWDPPAIAQFFGPGNWCG